VSVTTEPTRGVIASAEHDYSWGPRVFALARGLTDAERTLLQGVVADALNGVECRPIVTTRGGTGDMFWAHLSNVGIVTVDEDAVPQRLIARRIGYRVAPKGLRTLRHLGGDLVQGHAT